MTVNEIIQLGASIAAILFVFWLAKIMGLGGDVRISDAAHARRLANEAVDGFDPVDMAVDRAGMAALLKDASGRHMVLRRHGNKFVGRLLDSRAHARLDRNFLTIGTGERLLAPITLDLGQAAQIWAAGMRVLPI